MKSIQIISTVTLTAIALVAFVLGVDQLLNPTIDWSELYLELKETADRFIPVGQGMAMLGGGMTSLGLAALCLDRGLQSTSHHS